MAGAHMLGVHIWREKKWTDATKALKRSYPQGGMLRRSGLVIRILGVCTCLLIISIIGMFLLHLGMKNGDSNGGPPRAVSSVMAGFGLDTRADAGGENASTEYAERAASSTAGTGSAGTDAESSSSSSTTTKPSKRKSSSKLSSSTRTKKATIKIAHSHRSETPILPPQASTAIITSDSSPVSKEECLVHYGTRNFLESDDKRTPAVLYSYPGSGNTFARLLIDYGTGIYTGAMFDDERLVEALPGQEKCDSTVIAVKAHPVHFKPVHLLSGRVTKKCRREGRLIKGFERYILLYRDPFAAIWSDYQRRLNGGSHSKEAREGRFSEEHFAEVAVRWANDYVDMLNDFKMIERKVRKRNVMKVTYEDLMTREGGKREEVLREMVLFLGRDKEGEDRRRLECAFVLADRRDTRRSGKDAGKQKRKVLTREDVYTKELVCEMWEILEEGGAAEMGYRLPEGIMCD
ncbi:hypothetical protein VYU27_009945 [Nannochloropsis oceanica]